MTEIYNRQIGEHCPYQPAPWGNGQFISPMGVAVYGDEVYAIDYANRLGNKMHVFNLAGVVQRAWGPWGVMGGGNLQYCGGVFVYGGEVYVIDEAFSKITVYNTAGVFQREFGVSGTGNGEWILAYKLHIFNDEIYIPDGQNNRIMVVGLTGTYKRKWGSTGSGDGQFSQLSPYSCCVYNNELYVTDLGNYRVQVFDLNGTFKRKWGSMGSGDGQFGQYAVLTIAVASGEVFVADTINNRITVFDLNGTFKRKFGAAGSGVDQFGANNAPVDIYIYNDEVFLVDTGASANHRVQVWETVPPPPFKLGDFTDDNAFFWSDVDLSPYAGTDLGSTPYYLKLLDGAGKKAIGYIGAVGAGETLGSELVDGWTNQETYVYETWTPGVGSAITQAVNDESGNTYGIAYKDVVCPAYWCMKIVATLNIASGSFSYGIGPATSQINAPNMFNVKTTTIGTYGMISSLGAVCINIYTSTAVDFALSGFSAKRVTDPPSTAVHIVSSLNGTTRNWASIESGFNPNDIASFEVLEVPDPPAITAFEIPASYASKTVPITVLTASNSPTAYLLTESGNVPEDDDPGWTEDPPASYVFDAFGLKVLYPWAKNEGGISSAEDASNYRESVFVYDPVPPVVSAFDLPLQSNSLTVSVNTFTLTGVYITGYLLTEMSDVPDIDDSNWNVNPWTQYVFGSDGIKTLYAWGKNVYGISDPVSDQVTIILTPPAPPSGVGLKAYLKFDVGSDATKIYLPDGSLWGYAKFIDDATRIFLADGTPWGYLEFDEKTNTTRIYLINKTLWAYWEHDIVTDSVKIYLGDGTPWGAGVYNSELGRSEIFIPGNTIGINDSVAGVLTTASPPDPAYPFDIYYSEDWDLVGAVPGQDITVTMLSPDFIVWIDILDATDLATPLFAGYEPITFTPQAGISYVIRASTDNELEVGSYTLTTVS